MNGRPPRTDRIVFSGMEMPCRVGATPAEAEHPQTLRIVLELKLDLGPAAASDDLAHTVDYGWVARQVSDATGGGPYRLLETVADRILRSVTASARVVEAQVEVGKARPPLGAAVGSVSIVMRRTAEEYS